MKLKYIFFFLVYAIYSFKSFPKSGVDSLMVLLNNHAVEDQLKADLLNQIGFEYWIIDPLQSEKYGSQALTLSKNIKYISGQAFANRVIGVAHWSRGNYDLALSALFKGLKLYKHLKDSLGQANCMLNIGMIYADQHDINRALDHYKKAKDQFFQLNELGRVATTYNKIGALFIDQQSFTEAFEVLNQALKIHEEEKFMYGISETNNLLGSLYYHQGKYDKGLQHFFKSIIISQENQDIHGLANNYQQVGHIYLMKGDFERSKSNLEQGKIFAQQVKSKKILLNIYRDLKELSLAKENYKLALIYMDQYAAMKDSIFNEEMAIQIANIQSIHEMEDKDRLLQIRKSEITLLEQQARIEKIMRFALILGLIILGFMGFIVFKWQRHKIKRDRELHKRNEELFSSKRALMESELENAKLKEHDLVNELEYKNKELTSFTINFIQKNQLMEELKLNINKLKKELDEKVSSKLHSLNKLVDNTLHIDKDWKDFRLHFENVHKDFFNMLKENNPELSNYELKLCALIRINLNMKEMATILGISTESVKTARYRLRKKLGLKRDEGLIDYIVRIEKEFNYAHSSN